MFQNQSAPTIANSDHAGTRRRVSQRGPDDRDRREHQHDDPAGVERERRAEVTVHRGDDRARHAAERARDAGGRAQRARDRRVHRAAPATPPRPRPCRPPPTRSSRACARRPGDALHHARACLATTTPSSRYSGCVPYGTPTTFGADARRELVREVRAHRDRQREPAIEELVDRREVGLIERGDVPRRDRVDGHGRGRAPAGSRRRGSGRARRSFPPRDRRVVGRAASRPSR